MRSSIERAARYFYSNYIFRYSNISYSQNGEDIIIKNLFNKLRIQYPTYLDIGANHPIYVSNTYLLYVKGSKGVCIEPNPILYQKLKRTRSRDTCINAGVAFDEKREADFYLFPYKAHGLSTFSKQEADFWEQEGNENVGTYSVEKVLKMKLVDINSIIENHFAPHPNFISIDVEGLDLQILKTLDFERFKPEVICVETLNYHQANKESKEQEIEKFLTDKGYFVYADTYLNTIFCSKNCYKPLL
jgi:FkbM family methyltransferase